MLQVSYVLFVLLYTFLNVSSCDLFGSNNFLGVETNFLSKQMKLDESAKIFFVVKNFPSDCLFIIIATIYLKLKSFSSVYEVEENAWFQLFLKVSSTLCYTYR